MTTLTRNHREDNLQILRFIAAGLVLLTHITFYIHERVRPDFAVWHSGEVGVPIFFIISGYVMYLSGLKLTRDADGARHFIHRRIARVFPLYWLITTTKLLITLAAPAAVLHGNMDWLYTAASYVLFPMWNLEGEVRPLYGVGWTLLHEMFFYYVFSTALLLRHSPFAFSTIVIGGLCLLGPLLPAGSALVHVITSPLNLLFIAGMALAAVHTQGHTLPAPFALPLLLVGVLLLFTPMGRALQGAWAGGFNVGAICVVAAFISLRINRWPVLKDTMVQLGDSSYSLYMLHPMLAPALCVVLVKLHVQMPAVIITVTALSCLALAHAFYLLAERRLNRNASIILMPVFDRQLTKQ